MKLFSSVVTLLFASSFLIVGCSEPSGKKATFSKPVKETVEAEIFGLDLATRQKLFVLLMKAEQKAINVALDSFDILDKSKDKSEFREKTEKLKAVFYSEILTPNNLTLEIGEAIIIEGVKANWKFSSIPKKINTEKRELPAKNSDGKTIPKDDAAKVK
jgi:hypothetical protein